MGTCVIMDMEVVSAKVVNNIILNNPANLGVRRRGEGMRGNSKGSRRGKRERRGRREGVRGEEKGWWRSGVVRK